MKVLIGPRVELGAEAETAALCRRLAGEDGSVVLLRELGVKNLYRQLSPAEIETIRDELRKDRDVDGGLVGYVCRGVHGQGEQSAWVVVIDHANLTWRSPLIGPNDEQTGPRFPSLDQAYAPEAAMARVGGADGMIVAHGVVAGVGDDRAMSGYEMDMIRRHGWAAASSELVAPVIIAAHMGLRVAAVVITV
jgi:purine-nucleoside phosphorylase